MRFRLVILAAVLLIGCQAASEDGAGNPGPSDTTAAGGTHAVAVGSTAVDASVDAADGVPIHYRTEGSGSPALVFIHCWSCDSSYWREQVPYFAPKHRVVTIDLGGHGTSGADRDSWSIATFAGDVRAVVDELGLDRVVLIGHSLGGYVMVETALQIPDKVVALVAVDSLQDAELSPTPDEVEGFLEPFASDFHAKTQEYVRSLFGSAADPALIERIADEMSGAPTEIGVASLRGVFEYQLAPGLGKIKQPIHAIVSQRFPVRLDVNRKYAPQFQTVTMTGVGHFLMLEDPENFNLRLEETLSALADAS